MSSNKSAFYARLLQRRVESGDSPVSAYGTVADAYLAGRPAGGGGRRSIHQVDRDCDFWLSGLWNEAPNDALCAEPFVLALTQYLQRGGVSAPDLLRHVAERAPRAFERAVRYSLVFVRRDSVRWQEIERIGARRLPGLEPFFAVCDALERELGEFERLASEAEAAIISMHPVDVLGFASLFAFEHLLPPLLKGVSNDSRAMFEAGALAISDLLRSTIRAADDTAFEVTEVSIASRVRKTVSPFLFPSAIELPDEKAYAAIKRAISQRASAQAYRANWVGTFAFDEDQEFAVNDGKLEATSEGDAHVAWRINGRKLELLHHYWMGRAIDEARSDPMTFALLKGPATDVQKLLAHLRARRNWLQLTEVYGVDSEFVAGNGVKVELFVALRTLELLTAFFTLDFAQPFLKELALRKDWRLALHALAMTGFRPEEFHIRFPLTWSRRRDKIESLKAWTASELFPKGNARVMEAVLDFWTCELESLRTAAPRDVPELHERPFLKLGSFLFQLPWMMAAQNNATASINNFRRLGARRAAVRDETQRTELSLAERLRERGFRVRPNYRPTCTTEDDAGEVDIVCARDGHLFILELKSTYVRRSLEAAWRHRTTTLRRAAGQLRRKVAPVMQDLAGPLADLETDASAAVVHLWIVDTCIEHDHELIDGLLKVSLQEVLIALRDDRELLRDLNESADTMVDAQAPSTLYPNGFSGAAFALAIESEAVWENALTSSDDLPH